MVPFLNKIGKCPVCGKGDIVENEVGFTCNHFKKNADGTTEKCNFIIYHSFGTTYISSITAKQITEKGISDELQLFKKDGGPFRARLKLYPTGKVGLYFDSQLTEGKCPHCGGNVKITSKGYSCEHYYLSGADRCLFHIPKVMCQRPISIEEVEDLLAGRAGILDGFVNSQTGSNFSSRLTVLSDGTVRLESKVAKCPVCGGDMHIGPKFFNCSNFRHSGCRFKIWRQLYGHRVTIGEVQAICNRLKTDPITFMHEDGNKFTARLAYDGISQVTFVNEP